MKKYFIVLALVLASCASKSGNNSDDLVSIQILDRNGFSETISAKERLGTYEDIDFIMPQPYQKVTRVYGRASQGKTFSKVTTYHSNGQPWQYLEVENGRAHGQFIEWHPNGQKKIDAIVIEGTADVSEMAQMSWLFDGISNAYDEQGRIIAKILYEKGLLEGPSSHYHPDGSLSKEIPYQKDVIHGFVRVLDEQGVCIEKISYHEGEKDGPAYAYWAPAQYKYRELYEKGRLMEGEYFDPKGEKVAGVENGEGEQAVFENNQLASLIEHRKGDVDGAVKFFDAKNRLVSLFHLKNGMKNGDEWEYYPSDEKIPRPKLHLQWSDDVIQGVVKTWYENGVLESQREMHENKKHGLCFAWFKEGDLMLMEEYENDQLMKGSYFKKWERAATSKVDNGKGVATLFDQEGKFVKKIIYEKGIPQDES
jgi:antitoxin component YwqK of YwqJK toxin-antitoxin module